MRRREQISSAIATAPLEMVDGLAGLNARDMRAGERVSRSMVVQQIEVEIRVVGEVVEANGRETLVRLQKARSRVTPDHTDGLEHTQDNHRVPHPGQPHRVSPAERYSRRRPRGAA